MQRRQSLGKLRGLDPVTLEVTITEALRRPLSQLDAAGVVDLLALSESDEAPRQLRKDLLAFRERISNEIGDLPDGHVWQEWMTEIGQLEPSRVSAGTRELLSTVARAEGRTMESIEAVQALEDRWEQVEADTFEIGGGKAKVEKHRVMNTSEPLMSKRSIRIASDKKKKRSRRSGGGSRAGGGGGGAPNRRAAPPNNPIDEDKLSFLVQTCLDRLGRYGDKGLAEPVLVVGVRKKAEAEYPGTSGKDVQTALKHLKELGKVKNSAGRWMVKPRW